MDSKTIPKIVYGFMLVFFYNISLETFHIFDFKTAVISKNGLRVRHGHRKCHHATKRM